MINTICINTGYGLKIFIIILYSIFFLGLGCAPTKEPGCMVNDNQIFNGNLFALYLGQGFIGQDVLVTINGALIYADNTTTDTNGIAAYIPFRGHKDLAVVVVEMLTENMSIAYSAKYSDGQFFLISITNKHFEILEKWSGGEDRPLGKNVQNMVIP